jgi:hypothetical protein
MIAMISSFVDLDAELEMLVELSGADLGYLTPLANCVGRSADRELIPVKC